MVGVSTKPALGNLATGVGLVHYLGSLRWGGRQCAQFHQASIPSPAGRRRQAVGAAAAQSSLVHRVAYLSGDRCRALSRWFLVVGDWVVPGHGRGSAHRCSTCPRVPPATNCYGPVYPDDPVRTSATWPSGLVLVAANTARQIASRARSSRGALSPLNPAHPVALAGKAPVARFRE